jgi:condensin-2 complex subunit D3
VFGGMKGTFAVNDHVLQMLGTSCRDPAVSVRKEMVQILSDLLQQYPDDKELAKIWTKCVVPLVLDQEGKLQECVLKVNTTE